MKVRDSSTHIQELMKRPIEIEIAAATYQTNGKRCVIQHWRVADWKTIDPEIKDAQVNQFPSLHSSHCGVEFGIQS